MLSQPPPEDVPVCAKEGAEDVAEDPNSVIWLVAPVGHYVDPGRVVTAINHFYFIEFQNGSILGTTCRP